MQAESISLQQQIWLMTFGGKRLFAVKKKTTYYTLFLTTCTNVMFCKSTIHVI